MVLAPKKSIVRITALERERHAPRGGESYATRDARIRVMSFLRVRSGAWEPSQIARLLGGDFRSEVVLVRRACLSLWAQGLVRKTVASAPKQTFYQWVG